MTIRNGPENNYGVTPGRMGPLRSVDVLDDARQPDASVYWSDPPASIDWQSAYNERAQHTAELTATIAALRSDLSSAQTDVSVYRVLAAIGWSVAVLAVVWHVV